MYARHASFMSSNLMVGVKVKNYGPADAGMQPQTNRFGITRSFMLLTPDCSDGIDSQKGSAEEREQGTY
jgi:hypothetical protein